MSTHDLLVGRAEGVSGSGGTGITLCVALELICAPLHLLCL